LLASYAVVVCLIPFMRRVRSGARRPAREATAARDPGLPAASSE
jgi:hypothetical protein